MEARRTFGGASGSKQLGIMAVALIVAVVLAVASAFLAKSLTAGSGTVAPAAPKTYIDAPKDFPDRPNQTVVVKPDLPKTYHYRPGSI